ncbi:MAG: DoxX-like family protein [Bermanella sp.]
MKLFAKLSLSFLWIFTGITSIYFSSETGYEILAQGGITGLSAKTLLTSGSVMDIVLGVWILTHFYTRWCYITQLAIIIIYSFLLSYIAPEFWLHPFGPITKNLPIIALILFMLTTEDKKPLKSP